LWEVVPPPERGDFCTWTEALVGCAKNCTYLGTCFLMPLTLSNARSKLQMVEML